MTTTASCLPLLLMLLLTTSALIERLHNLRGREDTWNRIRRPLPALNHSNGASSGSHALGSFLPASIVRRRSLCKEAFCKLNGVSSAMLLTLGPRSRRDLGKAEPMQREDEKECV
ncbi:unnamed protein product [Heligmosomoides polygyrus]|uniref:Secreted protein n=1 Tax=Heligmosomoides polygyrus TaxID=6339 RepID=A0A183FXI7_HELPZ|nr:unnamed protein product [Heligmosomoides polygyrus]